nr:flagellar export protein FliJ [uncultured Massilia sp.]
MSKLSALETLIDLVQRESDACAKRLAAAMKAVEEAQQKLQMLHGYRDDYANRLDAAMISGITPFARQNFVAFLDKLEAAVNGQAEVIQHAQRKAEKEKKAWQESERKRLSYRTLTERAAAQALALDNKRDQKMMDDYAARSARRNSN